MSETVTQLLDRYDDDLMELARLSTQGMFDKDLYASASEARQQIVDLVAAARREVETMREAASRTWPMTWNDKPVSEWTNGDVANYVAGYWRHLYDASDRDLATSRAALEDVLWQEAHPNVEVVSRRRAEDDEKLWVAYDRSGNVNDTEWFAIAEGDTWKEALRNARRALAQEAGDAK